MAASTAFFGTFRGLRDILSQIIEIDQQMTVLRRVSSGEIERNHILRESVELAERLGNRIAQINEGLSNYARQGFRGEGLIAMTEAATLFSNISEMSVDEAADGLTSIANGFSNIDPSGIMVAVDAINEVDKFIVPYISNGISKLRICWKPLRANHSSLIRKLVKHLKTDWIGQSAGIDLSS